MAEPPVVMVTGASAGVGRAIAVAFAREGTGSACWRAGAPGPTARAARSRARAARRSSANVTSPTPTHGRFDSRARRRSWQLWVTEHRAALSHIAAGVAAALVGRMRIS